MDKLNGHFFWLKMKTYWKKYYAIWDKVSADIQKEFDCKPVYNKKVLKTKIKSHGDEVTHFYDKEIPDRL